MDKLVFSIVAVLVLSIVCVLFAGCSTANGLCRDIQSLSEAGVGVTQKLVDKQQESSIAHAVREQNLIIQRGRKMTMDLR